MDFSISDLITPVTEEDDFALELEVFISYARGDGTEYAKRLFDDLRKQGIKAWRDTASLNPYTDFTGEIMEAIERASHVVVCITPDVRRKHSFVLQEISYARAFNKPIIPLIFPGGICPISIINHTHILFHDWAAGFVLLLERLKDPGIGEIMPETRRQMELKYLQDIGQRYDHWRHLYTDLSAIALEEERKVKVKTAALHYLEMQHDLYKGISYEPEYDHTKVIKVEDFEELCKGIRKYGRVALIGDPGGGKTTTLERLAFEHATEAAEDEYAALPVFVRLGDYEGKDFGSFIESAFGGLRLDDYLPGRVFLLLDGLNETPPEYVLRIRDWIIYQTDVKLVVTCRRLDYVGLKLPLQRIDVNPLNVKRIHLFIGNYLEDDDQERLFWALSGAQTEASWEWLRKKKGDITFDAFWFGEDLPGDSWEPERRNLIDVRKSLREEGKLPGMLGVVSNPFLLFLTIRTFVGTGKPPVNRGQLFQRFIHQLFEKRGRAAAITLPPWIDESIQRKALAALAHRMQAERTGTSVEESWARYVIQEALPSEDAEHLLYLAASASIIDQGEIVRFVHHLLQEYFAAYGIKEDIQRGAPASKYFPGAEWWKPTGWEETVLLLAGMEGDATKLVEWLTPVQPILAYLCATESGATCAEDALLPLFDPVIPPLPVYGQGPRVGLEVDEWRAKLPHLTPLARAEWGRRMAKRGDTRRGVGVRLDGLPDIDWVEIPAGKFKYGGDPGAQNSAERQEIDLPTFYIARYPITYSQFQTFLDARDGIQDDRWWEGLAQEFREPFAQNFEYAKHLVSAHQRSLGAGEPFAQIFKYANHPCEMVSWYQAVAFCRWFSFKLDGEYALDQVMSWAIRLPIEQEWEKAARGTDGRIYPWGNEYIPGTANVDETESGVGPYWLRSTTAVGVYLLGASPYGVLDMIGNVWEWCLTEHGSRKHYDLNTIGILRGGSWMSPVEGARVARRYRNVPGLRRIAPGPGFRVVCASPNSGQERRTLNIDSKTPA